MSDVSLLCAHIRGLEERLLRPEIRRSSTSLASLLAEEFIEIGTDGGRYTRENVIASLQAEDDRSWSLTDFRADVLAGNVILATYRARRQDRLSGEVVESLRSSIWTRVNDGWQMLFHQGTRVES